MRKKLALNTLVSLIYQMIAILSGFILPRCILNCYGSSVNGLVSSINQFLQIISFLELGMGAVVQSSLYEPLYRRNFNKVSEIWVSANRFFRRIALILIFYIAALVIVYPHLINSDFDSLYTGTLILAISISSFAQYYFGIVNQLLVTADQKGYVHYFLQIGAYLLNIVVSVILINYGLSIQVVKFVSSIIFLLRPFFLYCYVKHNYNINHKIKYDSEPIKQKWNGVAQHITAVVLDSTDTIVLTLLSTLENVSIYAVYHLVIYGIKTLFVSMTNGIQALLGEIVARNIKNEIIVAYRNIEWVIHTAVVFLFGCTGILVVPFIKVYTKGITDINYIAPLFACILTLAHGCHSLRLPYNMVIKAYGKYKETQGSYIIATIINLLVSIITVKIYGLVGVAIGTLVAMLYQTVWMAIYTSHTLINTSISGFIKQIIVDICSIIIASYLCLQFKMTNVSYWGWCILAIKVVLVWVICMAIINGIFYRDVICYLISKLKKRKGKGHIAT